MAYSSSDDDDDNATTTKGKSSQLNYLDDDFTSGALAPFERRRLEWEKKKQERERQRQRQREKKRNNNTKAGGDETNDDDDDDDGSADLLAVESPLASPSPPQSPLIHHRSTNGRNNFHRNNANKERSSSPLLTCNGDTASKIKPRRSPSALKHNHHRRRSFSNDSPSSSPSPNRVAFAATTTMKKNNQSQPPYNNLRNNNTARRKKPAWAESSSDSDNDIMKINLQERIMRSNNNMDTNKVDDRKPSPPKKKNPPRKKLGAINYESSSDDEDFGEKMKQKLLEMKKKKQVLEAAAAAKASTTSAAATTTTTTTTAKPITFVKATAKALPIGPSSPFKSQYSKKQQQQRRGRLHHLQESSSDDDENFVDDMSAKLQARKLAERDARYNRRNPIHAEKRRQEEEEERRLLQYKQQQKQQQQQQEHDGLEGTTILVDGADQKSVSDMGEDNRRSRGGGVSPGDGGAAWKQSRRYSPVKRNDDDDSSSNKRQRRVYMDSDDDGLWDDPNEDEKKKGDDDGDDSNDGDKKPRARSRGRPKGDGKMKKKKKDSTTTQQPRKRQRGRGAPKLNDHDDDSVASEPSKRQTKSKKDAASKKQNVSRFASLLQDSDDQDDNDKNSISEQDKEDMKLDLKPTFTNPKLGPPSALVPFVLSKEWKVGDPITNQDDENGNGNSGEDADENVDQVPASINRYLFPYQREGVQFMYKSVIHGKGCVLGDDMGLGKTVQMVSLIAALQKKTGTALDFHNIQSHRKKALQIVKTREKNDRQALLSGMCSRINNKSILEELGLPKFAPILIIVPPSVAENWASEFATWGHFNVAPIYQGSTREKALDRIKTGLDFTLIVGKSIFSRADDFDALNSVKWKLIIVDEYHEYKNQQTTAHMRLADLRDNSACPVIGMTGTLMQNNHKELYYLIDMVRPGLFGDWTNFRLEFSDPLKYARAKDAKAECVSLGKEKQKVLDRMLKPVYLVRKKEDVLQNNLTKKNEKVIFCQLSEVQKQVYRHILTLPDYDLLRFANAPCECGINMQYFIRYRKLKTKKEQIAYQRRHKDQLVPKKQCCFRYPMNPYRDEAGEPDIDPDAILWQQLHEKPIGDPDTIAEDILDGKYITCKQCPSCVQLPAMNKLMKVCSHPSLLQVAHSETGESKRKKLEFAEVALPPEIRVKLPGGTLYQYESLTNDHVKLSGKMKTLDHLLKKFQRQQHRVLVFSHSTATLDIIQNHCRISGWEHLRLDGKTPSSSRQGLVDKFQKNDDIFLFLISTKAGGLGLNLTAANKVIIFDVNWNPSYDEQAQDRAFRIGQKRDVEVTRLVARGTIEELIYQRQVYKVQLKKQTLEATGLGEDQPQIFRGVDKDKNRKGELFGIENLLKFKDGSFMSSLWKKSDNPFESIDEAAVQAELDKRTEDDLDELAERDDEFARSQSQNNESGNETSENEYEGIDHGDYFNNQRGRARVVQGDDAFDEEMGGVSQMIAATTAMAVQNIYSSDEEASKEECLPGVKSDVKPPPKENDVKSSPKEMQVMQSRADESGPASQEKTKSSSKAVSAAEKSDSADEEIEASKDKSDHVENLMSPEPSTGTQSVGSLEGLRTQYELTPKTSDRKKAAAPAKFSLMGVSFEKSSSKKSQSEKKSEEKSRSSGLYIPKY